jgi:hypothetical protein
MIRAYVTQSRFGDALCVSIVNHDPDETAPRMILRLVNVGEGDTARIVHNWAPIDAYAETDPTFTLGHLEATALLAGLATFYQGVDDARMLRKDYDAERGRVDKLVDVVSAVARGRVA